MKCERPIEKMTRCDRSLLNETIQDMPKVHVSFKFGNTHVLCTATVDDRVPGWLRGQNRGWVTA